MNISGVVCAGWYNDSMKKKSDYQASNRHSMMFLYQNEIVWKWTQSTNFAYS